LIIHVTSVDCYELICDLMAAKASSDLENRPGFQVFEFEDGFPVPLS
jgi:hypothetical protein